MWSVDEARVELVAAHVGLCVELIGMALAALERQHGAHADITELHRRYELACGTALERLRGLLLACAPETVH